MGIKEKMENAKEVDMFPELSQDEKIEAIVEGKVQIALIKELEKIKIELLDESYNDDYESGKIIVDWEDIDRIFNKHISELKEK